MLWTALSAVHTTILRLPCLKYADFSVYYKNKALRGHLLYRDFAVDDLQCMAKCAQHAKCKSYNINKEKQICELNAKTYGEANTQLSDEEGWLYKSTDYDSKLVSVH